MLKFFTMYLLNIFLSYIIDNSWVCEWGHIYKDRYLLLFTICYALNIITFFIVKEVRLVLVLPDCSTYHPLQRGAGGPVAAVLAGGLAYPGVGTQEPQEEAHAAYLQYKTKAIDNNIPHFCVVLHNQELFKFNLNSNIRALIELKFNL